MEALGIIETIGMVPAVETADVCLKSANVRLIGYELSTGGMVTIKVTGDVGAVKASVDAAKSSPAARSKIFSTLVIPRPAKGIELMVNSKVDKTVSGSIRETTDLEEVNLTDKREKTMEKEVCNLCHDPKCPRRRSQPKNLCIHYKDTIKTT